MHLEIPALERRVIEGLVQPELQRLAGPCNQALDDAGVTAAEIDSVLLVGGMTRMPAVQATVESIFGKAPSKDLNPDEIVAAGAAIQGSVMGGELQEILLLDVVPHSVGIRVKGDRFSKIIERNTRIPCRELKVFRPVAADQNYVSIEIFQGESATISQNRPMGNFELGGLPVNQDDPIHVEVSFTVDANGMLDVSATEMQSGKSASVKVNAAGGLSNEEIERLIAERSADANMTT